MTIWTAGSINCKEIPPVHPKGNQSWIFIGRTEAEAETPILRSPDEKNWLTGKDPDAGKDWRQEEKGTTEDEMFGWHHWLDGHEFEWFLGVGDGQGSLECCSPWVANSWTRLSNWIELNWTANAGDRRDMGLKTHSSILAWRIPWTEDPDRLGP